MKKRSFRETVHYHLDRLLSKGPLALIALLFTVTLTLVCFIGLVAYLIQREHSLPYQLWMSLMHALDTGTLAADSTENILYLVLMTVATLCGLFITSILIGIITSGIENKLSSLRKGTTVVQEAGHTLIIGFNEHTITLIRELIEANANRKLAYIVILGEIEKEEMEDIIFRNFPDTRSTQIICRSGVLHELASLERCAPEHAHSIIVNQMDDILVIKCLLALSVYLKKHAPSTEDQRIIAAVQRKQHIQPAILAAENRAEILYVKDAISRIIAHTCRNHGLSQVLTELFNYTGNELYLESIPQLTGTTINDAQFCLNNAIIAGIYHDNQAHLNPPGDTVIQSDDLVVLLERDDGSYVFETSPSVDRSAIITQAGEASPQNANLLVLGTNNKLPLILQEYNQYVAPGTQIYVVDDQFDHAYLPSCSYLDISVCSEQVTYELLEELLTDNYGNILLLNDDSTDSETSDSITLLRLIYLRDIADKSQRHFSITTEMRNASNQNLAASARVDDFVIGSDFINLLLTQLSEDHRIRPIIRDLLDEDGSEFYMKPVTDYVKVGVPVSGYTLIESAAQKGEIYVGYRKMAPVPCDVVVNPLKNELVTFSEEDLVIVIAES